VIAFLKKAFPVNVNCGTEKYNVSHDRDDRGEMATISKESEKVLFRVLFKVLVRFF